ncbi:fibronectin type III domain-containing protein [bacterium]|nr:fibronectin type III domain-containing protein [bacterium]
MMIFSLFSCSNVLLDNDLSQNQDEVLVTFSINSGNGNSTRTILPKTISDEINSEDYVYILSGKSTRGRTLENTEFNINDSLTISLSRSLWELTLGLYKKNSETEKVLLMEDTIVEDFSDGAKSISFSLSEKGIATNGGFNLQIQFTDTSQAVTKAKVELTTINKGETKFEQEYDDFTVSDENNEIKTLQCSNGEILPNQYRLEISFINKDGTIFSTWQDIIHIEPGRITEDEINISAGEIGNIPNAPSNLAAFYVNDSLVNGAYKVKLTWEDTSDNENQFNIYLYKINQETSEKELGETITAFPNENEIELTLDVGIYYDVEISSVNSVGESSISKRITGSTTDTTLTIISAEDFIFKEAE